MGIERSSFPWEPSRGELYSPGVDGSLPREEESVPPSHTRSHTKMVDSSEYGSRMINKPALEHGGGGGLLLAISYITFSCGSTKFTIFLKEIPRLNFNFGPLLYCTTKNCTNYYYYLQNTDTKVIVKLPIV